MKISEILQKDPEGREMGVEGGEKEIERERKKKYIK